MPKIYIKPAQAQNLDAMMAIIEKARQLLANDHNPQWQNGYPNRDDLIEDIQKHYAYVLMVDDKITGTATLFQEADSNYAKIYEGAWQPNPDGPNGKYAAIHRIAIDPKFSGLHLGTFFFSNLMSEALRLGIHELRIDTHAINKRMQHVIHEVGFTYAGIVYMAYEKDGKRNAYQAFLK